MTGTSFRISTYRQEVQLRFGRPELNLESYLRHVSQDVNMLHPKFVDLLTVGFGWQRRAAHQHRLIQTCHGAFHSYDSSSLNGPSFASTFLKFLNYKTFSFFLFSISVLNRNKNSRHQQT